MFFCKLWKTGFQLEVIRSHQPFFDHVYNFFCDVESCSYDFLKSALIDCHCLGFKGSLVVAGVITAAIELVLRKLKQPLNDILLQHISKANMVWDSIITKYFGSAALPMLQKFGMYIVERQRLIFQLYKVQKADQEFMKLLNIYKERCVGYYQTKTVVDPSEAFVFSSLQRENSDVISWAKIITNFV